MWKLAILPLQQEKKTFLLKLFITPGSSKWWQRKLRQPTLGVLAGFKAEFTQKEIYFSLVFKWCCHSYFSLNVFSTLYKWLMAPQGHSLLRGLKGHNIRGLKHKGKLIFQEQQWKKKNNTNCGRSTNQPQTTNGKNQRISAMTSRNSVARKRWDHSNAAQVDLTQKENTNLCWGGLVYRKLTSLTCDEDDFSLKASSFL